MNYFLAIFKRALGLGKLMVHNSQLIIIVRVTLQKGASIMIDFT